MNCTNKNLRQSFSHCASPVEICCGGKADIVYFLGIYMIKTVYLPLLRKIFAMIWRVVRHKLSSWYIRFRKAWLINVCSYVNTVEAIWREGGLGCGPLDRCRREQWLVKTAENKMVAEESGFSQLSFLTIYMIQTVSLHKAQNICGKRILQEIYI